MEELIFEEVKKKKKKLFKNSHVYITKYKITDFLFVCLFSKEKYG
jgi:hypothetical protein